MSLGYSLLKQIYIQAIDNIKVKNNDVDDLDTVCQLLLLSGLFGLLLPSSGQKVLYSFARTYKYSKHFFFLF